MQIFVTFARFPSHFLIGSNNHFACLSQHTRSFLVNSNDPFLIVFLAYFFNYKCFCIFFKPEKNKARFTRDAHSNVQNHFYGSNSDIKVGMLSGFTIRRVSSFQILGTRLSSLLYFTAYPLCLLKTIRPHSYQHTNSF